MAEVNEKASIEINQGYPSIYPFSMKDFMKSS
jgi:hypothetical protein